MKRICAQCKVEMIENCEVRVEFNTYNIKVIKKREGLFNNSSDTVKSAICSNCGNVLLYIDNYKKFVD